jgi:hypothetical protein
MRTVVILAMVAFLSGCAQEVVITSRPSMATVYVDSCCRGNTPITVLLSTDRPHTVTVALQGHRPCTVAINRVKRKPLVDPHMGNASLCVSSLSVLAGHSPAGLIASLCGRIVVDAFNAELVPNRVCVELEPL